MFQSVCQTVAVLHREGILVRSLKPNNILIDGLTPILAEVDMVDLPALSQIRDDLGGYRSYAAPEELAGQGGRSPTADVYALGKLLEYLLTGREPATPVGSRTLIADQKGTPPALTEIASRCLAADPADRYQYVEDLLADLENMKRVGRSAVLHASLRPGAVSRLKPGPAFTAKASSTQDRVREAAPPAKKSVPQHASAAPWLSRRSEWLAGGLGLLLSVLGAAVFYFAPRGVDGMQSAAWALSLGAGLTAWLLPRPARYLITYRIAGWAALASLVFLLGPIQLSAAHWESDLNGGSVARKGEAVRQLSRLGRRDFTGQNLRGVNLVGSELGGARFRGTNLEQANLSGTFLRDADFTDAKLSGANFSAADLRVAHVASAKGFGSALCDRRTRFTGTFRCMRGHPRYFPR
jgi:hypothetical protein